MTTRGDVATPWSVEATQVARDLVALASACGVVLRATVVLGPTSESSTSALRRRGHTVSLPLRHQAEHLGLLVLEVADAETRLDDLRALARLGGASLHAAVLASERDVLHSQLRTDPLTGVATRRVLADAEASPGGIGVVYVDLDGFKRVNDVHGHAAGDLVLTEVGARLARTVRDTDQVVRVGGDEFVVLCPDCRPGTLPEVAARIQGVLAEPYRAGDISLLLTASVGTAEGERSLDELIELADRNMYAMKREETAS